MAIFTVAAAFQGYFSDTDQSDELNVTFGADVYSVDVLADNDEVFVSRAEIYELLAGQGTDELTIRNSEIYSIEGDNEAQPRGDDDFTLSASEMYEILGGNGVKTRLLHQLVGSCEVSAEGTTLCELSNLSSVTDFQQRCFVCCTDVYAVSTVLSRRR